MLDRIEAVVGVESLVDAIYKLNPNARQDDPYGRGQELAGAATASSGLLGSAKSKLNEANKERSVAEAEFAEAEEAASEEVGNKVNEPIAGSPREDTGVRGMKNDLSTSMPAETDGSEATPDPSEELPLTRSWFIDNFGMSSAEMSEILIKAECFDALEVIQPLIIEERKAIVKQFPGVDPDIVDILPFTDSDYDQLNRNTSRFKIPFLQLVKTWTDSENKDERDNAFGIWKNRIDKSQRLSHRENNILKRCSEVLHSRGPMNAQTLKSYGVSAPSKEIAKLIRSHGFLFDIIKAGQGKRADDRCLFYDIDRPDVIIKNVGRFIGALLDGGGELGLDARGSPRLSLPFSSLNAPAYADAVKAEMAVNNVRAEGSWLIVDGENAVCKALEWSIPSMVTKRDDAIIMKKAIEGDEQAEKILSFNFAKPYRQMEMMKQWNWSIETFDSVLKEVITDGE